jgi:histidinol-phosphate aminotransferase
MQRHGGLRTDELRAFGLDPKEVIDFSASINPFGPSPRVREALQSLDLSRYPDPDSLALTEQIARLHGVTPDHILVGNGASELIHLVVRVFVRGGQQAVAFTPTFGEFERACEIVGASIFPWRANPERDFRWTLRNKAGVLRRVLPPLLYLCNPNNPTGIHLDEGDVRSIADGLIGGPMLLDEAYVNFVEAPWDATPLIRRGRVIVVRSMTKDYALAGLRLGYLVAHPDAVAAARRLQPEWSVGAAAQVAGLAALEDQEYLRSTLSLLREAKAELVDALATHEFTFHAGAANFLLIRVEDAPGTRLALLHRGVAVRDCTSFGLPQYIRVGVRTSPENTRLLVALLAVRDELPQEVAL